MSIEQILIALCGGLLGGLIVSIIVLTIAKRDKISTPDSINPKRQIVIEEISRLCTSVERLIQMHAANRAAHAAFRNALISEVEMINQKLKPNLDILDIYYVKYIESQLKEYLSLTSKTALSPSTAGIAEEPVKTDFIANTDMIPTDQDIASDQACAHDMVESALDAETTAQSFVELNSLEQRLKKEDVPAEIEQAAIAKNSDRIVSEPIEPPIDNTILFKPDTHSYTIRTGSRSEAITPESTIDLDTIVEKTPTSKQLLDEEPVLITDETMIIKRSDLISSGEETDLTEDEMPVINHYREIAAKPSKTEGTGQPSGNRTLISGDDVADKIDSFFELGPK